MSKKPPNPQRGSFENQEPRNKKQETRDKTREFDNGLQSGKDEGSIRNDEICEDLRDLRETREERREIFKKLIKPITDNLQLLTNNE